MKTLFLSQSEVKKLISAAEANEAVENAFEAFGKGLAQMPPKSYLFYRPYKGDLRTMPAYIESLNATGVKIVNVHVNNAEKNLPTVMATALRTGSAGAIAIKYLARDDSNIIGFIGCGAQAYTQIDTSILIKKFKAFKAYDINEKRRNDFANYVKNKYGLELIGKNDIQDVCNADVVTTTTPVNTPIVKNEWIKEGTHINAIGADAPGKEELEPAILLRSKIVVDNWEQASHSGEINVPLEKGIITKDNIYAELGQIVAKIKQGRTSNKEITIFDSTGLAVQDIAVAKRVYDKAVKNNIGIQLELLK